MGDEYETHTVEGQSPLLAAAICELHRTPLHNATGYFTASHFDVAELLVEHGANVNALDSDKRTPLHNAVGYQGDSNIVELLVKNGADVNARCKTWQYPADETYGVSNVTPLHIAASEGDTFVVRYLIKQGASVEACDQNNMTPLHWALFPDIDGNLSVVKILIKNGANVNAISKDFYSLREGWDQCRDSAETEEKSTALHLAIKYGSKKSVEFFISQGASVVIVDENGYTPLHRAAQLGQSDNVKILIKAGAIVDAKNFKNETPLHLACGRAKPTAVEALVSAGADINSADEKNLTPLDFAVASNSHYLHAAYIQHFLTSQGAVKGNEK